jgi:DNA-3-methyladenine glycosylase II
MEHLAHLIRDKRLKLVIEKQEAVKIVSNKNIALYLWASIMSQQLSTKVAAVIHKRFMDLYEGKPEPVAVLSTSVQALRKIGLSNAKTNYIQNIARFSLEQGIDFKKLNKMRNEEVIEYLTQIKGVGRWTAEMLLMFALGREDVFAVDDLGIQNAMRKLYKLRKMEKKELKQTLQRIAEKWSPYRTYACMYLWRWKDNARAAKATARI